MRIWIRLALVGMLGAVTLPESWHWRVEAGETAPPRFVKPEAAAVSDRPALPEGASHVLLGHDGSVYSLAFAADGRTLAVGSGDRTIRVWDLDRRRETHRCAGHAWGVHSLAFSPDGATLLSEAGDSIVRAWDLAGQKERYRFQGHTNTVVSVAFAPDGKTVASWSLDCTIRIWSMETGKEVRQLRGHQDQVLWATFSPDGHTLASSGADGTVRCWDVRQGREKQKRPGRCWQLSFAADGNLIGMATTPQGEVQLWDITRGNLLHDLGRHTGRACALRFAPDGRTVATGQLDGTIQLVEVATGQERVRFRGTQGEVLTLAFSADSRCLASGGLDSAPVIVWQLAGTARRKPLTADAAARLWKFDLGDRDGPRGNEAVWNLVHAPDQALALLGEHLRPVPAADPARIDRLIAKLDSDDFAVRQQAMQELERLDELAKAALVKASLKQITPEARRRIEQLLDRLHPATLSPELLRTVRAIEVLERIGTPQARELLTRLAAGAEGVRLTQEAQAALNRLPK